LTGEWPGLPKITRRRALAAAAWLASVAALPLVAACRSAPIGSAPLPLARTPAPSSSQPRPGVASAQAGPASAARIELRVHDWLQDPQDTFYGPFWRDFETAHPTIAITRDRFTRDDLHAKELELAASSQLGDVVRINLSVLTTELAQRGVIQALDGFVSADRAWNTADLPQIWPASLAGYTVRNQVFGLPVAGHPGSVLHYLNRSLASAAGFRLPTATNRFRWTVDEAVSLYRGLTTSSADGRPLAFGLLPSLGGEGTVGVLRAFGGDYYNAEGTKTLIASAESIAGLQWLADLWQKDHVAIPVEANADLNQVFPDARVGVAVQTTFYGTLLAAGVGPGFPWTVLPPPIGPVGTFATQASSDGIALSRVTKHPAEAWEVAKAYAGRVHGLDRFLGGLGNPGTRDDIWTAPEFQQKAPLLASVVYGTLVDARQGASLRPWNAPANGRIVEADGAFTTILQDVWLGKKKPDQAAAEAARAVQDILDKPPA
jgi:ABC-type glycerol-3-phosphate transport system substrate-binding protein